MDFIALESVENIQEGYLKRFTIRGKHLLLFQKKERIYLIEDQCGHLEAPLFDGEIREHSIVCKVHKIEFDLTTGENINRPYEVCNPIQVFQVIFQKGKIGFYSPD